MTDTPDTTPQHDPPSADPERVREAGARIAAERRRALEILSGHDSGAKDTPDDT